MRSLVRPRIVSILPASFSFMPLFIISIRIVISSLVKDMPRSLAVLVVARKSGSISSPVRP